jgi:hypothetical protein
VSGDEKVPSANFVVSPGRAWLALLAGPFAALLELLAVYVAAANIHRDEQRIVLHVIAAICCALALWGWLTSRSLWLDLGRRWPDPADEGSSSGLRMIASVGLLAGPLFVLLVLAQWAAILLLSFHPRAA